MKSSNIVIIAVVAVVVGAAGFFGGMQYEKGKAPVTSSGSFNGGSFAASAGAQGTLRGRNGAGMMRNGSRPVVGQILSIDSKTVTVQLADGSSKIVLLTDTTVVTKTDTGAVSDLKTGDKVGVIGTTNSDGSITAENVQLNPSFGGNQAQQQPAQGQ
jgi:hypothetical protein